MEGNKERRKRNTETKQIAGKRRRGGTAVIVNLTIVYKSLIVLFERSEFLIPTRGTSPKKKSVRVCACSTNLGFSVEKNVLVLVWKKYLGFSAGYQRAPGTSEKKKNAWYQRALRYQLRGRPFHPWAGRPRFSGAAMLTQSSSFSCRAGLQSESRLLLCCAPAVYMLAADAAVAAAVFLSLIHI